MLAQLTSISIGGDYRRRRKRSQRATVWQKGQCRGENQRKCWNELNKWKWLLSKQISKFSPEIARIGIR
jgi:hypothetical protein